jgi:YggT family protein
MLTQIGSLLIDTLGTLFVYVLLLRFHMQWLRAPFRNPVGDFIAALTNWAVLPARRIIPGILGLDAATLLLAWLAQALVMALLLSLRSYDLVSAPASAFGLLAVMSALELVAASIKLLIGAAIVQAILSFVAPNTMLAPVLDAITRRFYAPFRRFIPPLGGIDLSPLFLILAAQIALIVLGNVKQLAASPF